MNNERVKFIDYKGKRIFLADYSGLMPQKIIEILEEVKKAITSEPRNSVLFLGNLDNMHFNVGIISAFNKLTAATNDYVRANAMCGVKGLVKVMYDQYIKISKIDAKTFDNIEEAKEWLAGK